MKDWIVTPCFNRPEFLKVWIENVKESDWQGCEFIFCLDYGFDTSYITLIRQSGLPYHLITMKNQGYKIGKQSNNVLNGLMAAAKHSDGLVFYIEEDVFISKDFFRWHREAQKFNAFCTIATRNNNTQVETSGDLNCCYKIKGDYQALGVCFPKQSLMEIAPHFNNDYLKHPVDYCKENFPDSKIGHFFCEQDGLIRRIIEKGNHEVVFPHVPRAFHGGIYGYNRKKRPQRLSFEKRVELIKRVAFNKEELKKWVDRPEYYRDSEPCDLDTDFTELRFC